ncbi:biotin/lipoyl-containing protein [Ktedonosporobacter rubrisoli]|nr:biotin/lipoyl-containing protein [Ktedonosporobacter rubrisoli]
MPYIATVNKQAYHIDTGENGQRNSVTVEDKAYAIDWQQLAPLVADAQGHASQEGQGGRYSLLINGISYEIFARRITRPEQKDSQTYEIELAGQRFEVTVEDERAKLLAGLVRSTAGQGEAAVQAPMPGLVVGVSVEEGATVSAGQTVVILEAMKMENDLPAPISGVVKEIRVSKGQTVDQGDALVVIKGQE